MRNNEEDGSSDVSDDKLSDTNQNHDPGLTPLWVASKDGAELEVKKLLETQSFDIERGCYGMTPLFAAILFKNMDVVKLLLAAGADDSFIFSETKYTCLMLAVSMTPEPDDRPYPDDKLGQIHRQIWVVSHLLDNKEGNTSFFNEMGGNGKRPLDVVARDDIAEMLINAGADVKLKGQRLRARLPRRC
jgi:ankyrin repeat protein